MAIVHFYEKPGCFNNQRQKQLLVKAGHLLIVHDLLQVPWAENRQRLREFFSGLPVTQWFNPAAPAIKNGDIDPATASESEAIDWMVADPLLIRRPLMEVEGRKRVGFDVDFIDTWLGLPENKPSSTANLEACPKSKHLQNGQR